MLRMPGLGDAGARCARAAERDDGLGYAARRRRAVPSAGCAFRRRSRTPATSFTSSSRQGWPTSSSTSSVTRRRPAPMGTGGRHGHARPRRRASPEPDGGGAARPRAAALPWPRPARPARAARRRRTSRCSCHGLGERAPADVPRYLDAWHGPIAALDFTGHGLSTIPRGGGYTAEVLLADADAALRAVGEATVLGRGLGAYVALLLAGAPSRPGVRRHPARRRRHPRRWQRTGLAARQRRRRAAHSRRPIRSRWSSWPATSGPPTTRPASSGSPRRRRRSTSRSPWRP